MRITEDLAIYVSQKDSIKKNIKEPRIFPDHNIQELLKKSRKFFGKVSDGPFCGKKLQRFP